MGAVSLSAEQQAAEVTGNNLANVNDPNYSREQLVMDAAPPDNTPIGEEGTGVLATSISQIRDSFVDSQVVAQTSVTSSYSNQQSPLDTAEAYLQEQLQSTPNSTGSNGISYNLTQLFAQFSGLTTSTTGAAITVGDAQNLATQFNQVSAGLATVQTTANETVQAGVTSANQALSTIATLNQQIHEATASGETADTLVDQRQAALRTLAGYVNFTQSTDSTGAVDISIGGVSMVSGSTTPDQLQTVANSSGNLTVEAQNAGTPLSITGGSVGGSIAVTAPTGALTVLQNSVNSVASNLISQVNGVYFASTGQNFFTGTDASDIGVNPAVTTASLTTCAINNDNKLAGNLSNVANTAVAGLGNQTLQPGSAFPPSPPLARTLTPSTVSSAQNQSVAQMLSNQQSSISGVSTDEEMTNLIQYQKAYEASAELISPPNRRHAAGRH